MRLLSVVVQACQVLVDAFPLQDPAAGEPTECLWTKRLSAYVAMILRLSSDLYADATAVCW